VPFVTSAPNNYFLSVPGEIHSTISDIEEEQPTKDNILLVVQAFKVSPLSISSGESFTIDYTVFGKGASGLKQVELWRKDESSDWQQINTNTLAGETGPLTGSFTDTPSNPGKYWYGVHVVDNAGNWNDERNSKTKGQPSGFGPMEVQVNEAQSTTQKISSISETNMFGELGNLINALKDNDAGVQLKAAEELGKLADARAIGPLIEVLRNDENSDVRQKAAWALGQINDPGTVDPLSYASVKDADYYVRGEAYNALQKSTVGGNKVDSRSVDPIIGALKDEDQGVRLRAAEALGQLKNAAATDPLIEILRNDENSDVRQKAAWALGQICDPGTVDPLSYASVKDADYYVRGEAYNALQKSTVGGNKVDSRSVDPIIGALKDEDQGVRLRAAEALGQLKNATAVDPLIAALNDENSDVRQKAAWALGQIDDTRAVDPLNYASVNDSDYYVREEAKSALSKLGQQTEK
jgi:HEAT repeat protein